MNVFIQDDGNLNEEEDSNTDLQDLYDQLQKEEAGEVDESIQSINSTLTDADIEEIEQGLAEDLWIKDKFGIKLYLTVIDRSIVLGTGGVPSGWLNDKIIDASQAICKLQFPLAGGLQSCLLSQRPCFGTPTLPFVQILNLDPLGRGTHWVLLSNFNSPTKGTVNVYDSAHMSRVNLQVQKCMAQLIDVGTTNRMTIKWMESDQQKNGSDCGVYAIANLVTILFNIDPLSITYDRTELRPHLLRCLEEGRFKPFPTKRAKRRRQSLSGCYHTLLVQLVCSCKMPNDTRDLMFQCTTCKSYYHPKCQGISLTLRAIHEAKVLPCLSCQTQLVCLYINVNQFVLK